MDLSNFVIKFNCYYYYLYFILIFFKNKAWLANENWILFKIVICRLSAIFCLITCGVSLLTMAFIAINRYVAIFYDKKYKIYFSPLNTIFICLCVWIVSCLTIAQNLSSIIIILNLISIKNELNIY